MKNQKCIICANKTKKFEIDLPVFEHQNFITKAIRTVLFKCSFCQMIFRAKNINNNFFKSKSYINQNNEHKLLSHKYKIKTRSEILAHIVNKKIKKKNNLNILEVGCGKGHFLKKLSKLKKNSNLYGYDIGNYSKSKIFLNKNISFIKKKISFKENSLDLIVVSHTLNYFLDPLNKIKKYQKFLKKNGFLLILIPDIKKNLFYTLMSDQKTIISKVSLHNLLAWSGFSNSFIQNKSLPRELICFSKPSSKNIFSIKKKDKTLEKNLKKLKTIKQKILKIKSNNISIFGTNVNSAFVDQILRGKAKSFVSDFYNKNKFFRGKKVIGRKNLHKDKVLINCIKKNNIFLNNKTKAKIINIL